jgi:hypothetical protein
MPVSRATETFHHAAALKGVLLTTKRKGVVAPREKLR